MLRVTAAASSFPGGVKHSLTRKPWRPMTPSTWNRPHPKIIYVLIKGRTCRSDGSDRLADPISCHISLHGPVTVAIEPTRYGLTIATRDSPPQICLRHTIRERRHSERKKFLNAVNGRMKEERRPSAAAATSSTRASV
jgi:hypothetical protein